MTATDARGRVRKGRKMSMKKIKERIQGIIEKPIDLSKYKGKANTKALEKEYTAEEIKTEKEHNERNDLQIERGNGGSILAEIDEATLLHSMTPSEYFHKIKELKEEITSDSLQEMIDASSEILEKLRISGQKPLAEKLMRKITVLIKERNAALAGFDTIINTEDLYVWIHEIALRERDDEEVSPIKLACLEDYMRVIPDDVLEKLSEARNVFDKFYIVFTDYTGETERQVEKAKQDKDPILFGAFLTPRDNGRMGPADHLFFIADWVDQYCDLTLNQMIDSYQKATGKTMTRKLDSEIESQMAEIKKEFK